MLEQKQYHWHGAGAHNRRNFKKIIIKKTLSDSCSDSCSHKCSPSGYIGSELEKIEVVVAGTSRRGMVGYVKDSSVLTSTVFSQSQVFHIQPRFQGFFFLSPHPRGFEWETENSCRTSLVPRAYDFENRGGSGDENAV